jgi:diguanylate cyclase (GGDEF)-like protein
LNIDVIVKKLCEGAERIVPSRVFFFLARSRKFELVHDSAGLPEKGRLFDLKGTFVNMGVENKQTIYMSDIADSRIPVMPFKSGEAGSVLIIPMVYENSILGLFVLLSGQKHYFDAFQRDLLKVMCNQASTSIANAQLHAEIEKMATTDGLTGLFNHRLFQEKLSAEFKRLNRSSKPLSLLLADIDYFKKINDTYGHPVGDLVLKGVAKLIRETIREIDVPARYGGEEFAVILPETDDEGSRNIAERIRKALQGKSFSADGRSIAVTMSVGISTSPADARNKEELIEKADQALYHAKHNGRNQCVHWRSIK